MQVRMGRRAMWRRANRLSTRATDGSASCRPAFAKASARNLRDYVQPGLPAEALAKAGAGEGNRTLVVSLEGFCSTIELHPLRPKRTRQMAGPLAIVNRRPFLT